MTIKTLQHNDLVRLAGWNHVTYAKVGSVEGGGFSLDAALKAGHDLAWVGYAGSALSNSPAYYANEKGKAASATTLTDGETVEVEGRRYTVKVLPRCADHPRYSDPIHLEAA